MTFNLGHVIGATGADGKGIVKIEKTGTSGLVDTYTIYYTDETTSTFEVTNGSDGSATIVTSWESTTSDEKVPSEKLTKTTLDSKVDKVTGKGLSENDFTTTLKNKLDGIETGAEVNVNADWNSSTGDSQILNKPTIPSSSSDLSDGSDIIKKSSTTGLVKNDGTIDTKDYLEETDLTLFCNAIREAYTTYEIIPSSSEITTDESPITLTATLKGNNEAVANKTIELYSSSTLIDTDTTDNNGEVSFNVELSIGVNVFTFKYNESVTANCTVTKGTTLFYDPCNPSTHINDYILGNHIGLTQQTDYVIASHGRWNTEYLILPTTVAYTDDWDYIWEHSSNNINPTPYFLKLLTNGSLSSYYASINTSDNLITLAFTGNGETYDLTNYAFDDGSIIKVSKRGDVYSLYIDDVLVGSQTQTITETIGFGMGITAITSETRQIALKNIEIMGFD